MKRWNRPWILPVGVAAISMLLRVLVLTVYFPEGAAFDTRDETIESGKKQLMWFELMYVPMYVRVSGYAFGMWVGYLVEYNKTQEKLG